MMKINKEKVSQIISTTIAKKYRHEANEKPN